MKIWVDADACPVVIKEILFRAAERTQTPTILVANHAMRIPPSKFITGDIPLASEVIDNGGQALNPRGELYTPENIRSLLNVRDFMDTMRSSGVEMSGGPPPLSQTDRQNFANNLDRILAQKKTS